MKWPNINIGKVCLPTSQRDPRLSPDVEFAYIDIASINRVQKIIEQPQYIVGADAPSRARKVVRTGDILVSTVRPNLNAVAQVDDDFDDQIASTGFCILRANPKFIQSRYLYYQTITNDFINFLVARMRGANYPAVTDSVVKEATIPLPSLSEQCRIIEILDQANVLRRCCAEADAKAARLLPALFIKMFGDPVTNPQGWNMHPLGRITEAIDYGLAEQLSRTDTEETGIPIVRIANVLVNGEVDLSDMRYWPADDALKLKLGLKKYDLLFNWRNGSQEHIGKTAIWENEGEYIFVSFLLRIRCKDQGARPYYLWTLLNILRANGYFSEVARMQINRKFNATELSQLLVPNPPLELQDHFQNIALNLRQVYKQALIRGKEVEDLFSKLLRRAFTGDLTISWREGHMQELLTEMKQQASALGLKDTTLASNNVEEIAIEGYSQETLLC